MWDTRFRYKPQVDLGRVIENGEGWLNENEKSLISVEDLYRINEVVSCGRHCVFREGHDGFVRDGENRVHHWLRWFHVPMSYLITFDIIDDVAKFEQVKDQVNRYLRHLKTVVYPTYRKSDAFIEWESE